MKEKSYNISRILGMIGLMFLVFIISIWYLFEFIELKPSTNTYLLISSLILTLAYITLTIVSSFYEKISAKTSLFIWILLISYIIYLYANNVLGSGLSFIFIILFALAGFEIYKLKRKENVVKKNINTICIIVSIIVVICMVLTSFIYLLPRNKNYIIKRFEQNKELFENSVEELSNEEYIYFTRQGEKILISIHQNIEGKVNIINVKEEELYKYEKTIYIMNKLDLEHVSKSKGEIDFQFWSSFYPGGKSIAYITDLEHYKSIGNEIREKQLILENWHYIVTMSL